MKVHLSTLGCKLNESELEAWARRFAIDGYDVVDDAKNADIVVLNTCTVTHVAARKSRQMARQLARANPNARIVLTGCYVSVSPDEAKGLPNVALVVPNADKDRLVEKIADCRLQIVDCSQYDDVDLKSEIFQPRTRAFVKIEDGCNMSCTYCIIPIARGKERSRPTADVVAEVKSLVDAGYKEIILTGVQISSYRTAVTPALPMGLGENVASEAKQHMHPIVQHQSAPSAESKMHYRAFPSALPQGKCGAVQVSPFRESDAYAASSHKPLLAMTHSATIHVLRDLVAAILAETNVPRLRLTSIAPWDLDESLLGLFSDSRLCRHLHLSLQSGSDTVLRRMRRPYTTAQFERAVKVAREKVPDVGITTDVIVGFPGESDVEFEQSLEFVERMQFSRVHVFPYSARSGTVAAGLPFHVSDAVKESRVRQMQAVADASMRAFAAKFVGRTFEVLWESCEDTSRGAVEQRGEEDNAESPLHPSTSATLHNWSGYTDNYIRVFASSDESLGNTITSANLISAFDDGTIGNVIRMYPK